MEIAVNGGTKISEKEFLISTELLMRQLLKLDSIKAEGVAKLQRKAEVVFPNPRCLLIVCSHYPFLIYAIPYFLHGNLSYKVARNSVL